MLYCLNGLLRSDFSARKVSSLRTERSSKLRCHLPQHEAATKGRRLDFHNGDRSGGTGARACRGVCPSGAFWIGKTVVSMNDPADSNWVVTGLGARRQCSTICLTIHEPRPTCLSQCSEKILNAELAESTENEVCPPRSPRLKLALDWDRWLRSLFFRAQSRKKDRSTTRRTPRPKCTQLSARARASASMSLLNASSVARTRAFTAGSSAPLETFSFAKR